MTGFQCDRYLDCQDFATGPIHNCSQVNKACRSTGGEADSVGLPNTSAARSFNCFFQSTILFW
jgi:hypothetical protein